jgi:flagellar biosynthesis/type III secretory pathway M-ring protein FliF/YscJ
LARIGDSQRRRRMNVYMIEVSNVESQHIEKYVRRTIGYSSETNEYVALRKFGFRDLALKEHRINPIGKDEWTYKASNAVECLVYATKI